MTVSILFPDLLICQFFQHLNQARMIPSASAGSNGGVEKLLACGCVGQRHVEFARSLERQIQILSVQFDPESRFEVSLNHALSVDLQNLRRSKAADKCLPDLRWICTGFRSK